ncbi:MAG: sensor histidine kinase [Oscillospiraceae bacterium]|nr:sensor histidine kinase [Oscillospiraceae bacterium]
MPLTEGDTLTDMLHEPPQLPLECRYDGTVTINGVFYCVRIFPLQASSHCLCEILSSTDISEMSTRTDSAANILPSLNAVKFSVSNMRHDINVLKMHGSSDINISGSIESLDNNLMRIELLTSNFTELYSMKYIPARKVLFDVSELCRKLTLRCNTVLSQCDRCISYIEGFEKLYVRADSRRAVVALVNAVQNALMYSPFDSVPQLAVYSENDGRTKNVVIRLENDNALYTGTESDNTEELDFCSQRDGLGLLTIKCFAQLAGGKIKFNSKGHRTVLTLTLPMADMDEIHNYRLEKLSDMDCCDDIFDTVEQRMMEVVHLFNCAQ